MIHITFAHHHSVIARYKRNLSSIDSYHWGVVFSVRPVSLKRNRYFTTQSLKSCFSSYAIKYDLSTKQDHNTNCVFSNNIAAIFLNLN